MRSKFTIFVLCLTVVTFFAPIKAQGGLFDFLHRRHAQKAARAPGKNNTWKLVKQKPRAKPKKYHFQQQGF
jgi:hypothetical protein